MFIHAHTVDPLRTPNNLDRCMYDFTSCSCMNFLIRRRIAPLESNTLPFDALFADPLRSVFTPGTCAFMP